MQGELRFLIAFLWLMGSAIAATATVITEGVLLALPIMVIGGVGAAILAEWWCSYYD